MTGSVRDDLEVGDPSDVVGAPAIRRPKTSIETLSLAIR